MSLADHLEKLIHSSESHSASLQSELDDLERWAATKATAVSNDAKFAGSPGPAVESPVIERLRELRNTTINTQDKVEEDFDDITAHPQFDKHRKELISLLSSSQSDAEVSSAIAELVGYEELDFVMKLTSARHVLVSKGFESATRQKVEPKSKKGKDKRDQDFSEEAVKRRMAETFRNAAERPLFSGTAHAEAEVLPHVYTSASMTHNHSISTFGTKYLLPLGTTRRYTEDYEEVTVPPARVVPPRATERLVPCSELPPLAKGSFPGYTSLNRIQSIVYPTAFKTNENMLICGKQPPTGAGKTDVAMLTILRAIDQHRDHRISDIPSSVRRDDFKIIYVAPMKALAAEIVRKLGKRLAWLRIKVRELTGDMQLTKAEIAETQIIVTTPEKWDVVTRKPTGEGELATKVKLLIIDEVHLLNDERGAVIETIVARTIRQVEATQALIRVVGLSATLPNYIDVADFLRVSRTQGLFFFDSSFRPVPLEQHFLGVKGKSGSPAAKRALEKTAYHFVSELVREGHQVMVFVHSRKDTVKSAESLKELATLEGELDMFGCQEDPKFEFYRREIGMSKNKEMKQLFDHGFGIHHAGMLRSDRNLMERLFESKVIKVLCCTATLAWGVNLPAHGVLIKGTQLYDPSQGKFVDLSVLDVLQIFGRAGRPGMESSGVGYICTSEDKLQHYLEAVTAQHPIESKFVHGILDSLNAEIALGTVTNVAEGAEWLGYTYLFVRMRKNPMVYGMTHEDPVNDPDLIERRHSMITIAAKKLAEVGMIRFDEDKGSFSITDIGRIAAKFYVRYASIEVFRKEFRPKMTEADVLALLSMSTEFEQIQVRENEVEELKALEQDMPCQVKGGTDTSAGKVNILLQAYISKRPVEDFALVSDTMYAAQNGSRIIRALLEIALSRKWANASLTLMAMSKSVEKRIWGFEHPLKQFDLTPEMLYNLGRWADDVEVFELASMSAAELGKLIHLNEKHGAALLRVAKQFPSVILSAKLRPLSHELLLINIDMERGFEWSSKIHGSGEPFWVWVEDDSGFILQLTRVSFTQNTKHLPIVFIIPVPQPLPPSVILRAISDRWIGAEEEVVLELGSLVMPNLSTRKAHIMDLPLLRTDLKIFDPHTRMAFKQFIQFNSIQTQCVFSTYNTARNLLICASASSGKSLLGQLAIW
ncbi:Putative helicase mug81; AltName: Full=Meiotically up-regulated gene 81 protein [Serendipita indica DSM 11827]|nr:Putative helicase mug81; AltName: Full=Meiotically up-regulated gene 81 protein [Serendipita indica DSM 11827]